MVFASPLFLFVFLPLALAAYFALPRRAGNFVLLAASAAFYIWGEGLFIALVLASIAFNWLIGRRIDHQIRELVISQRATGYLALYRFDAAFDVIRILRIRHQREAGYLT